MTLINEFFDAKWCVNLKRRPDRLEHFREQARKIGIYPGVFEAFDGAVLTTKPGEPPVKGWSTISMGNYANVLSQRAIIINEGLATNNDSLLILEDDVEFIGSKNDISTFLSAIPENWDMIYFGGNHQESLIPIDNVVGRCQFTLTAHAVGIRRTMFKHLIHHTRKCNIPIDLYYAQLHKQYNVYCPLQCIATQMNGFSDIENKVVDYSGVIK